MTEEEIDQLEAEVSAAGIETARLQNRLQEIPRITEQLQHELTEAKNRREIALTQLRKVKPLKLPPVPSHDEMMAMARAQCQDRDPEVVKRLVGHLHACAATGANSGESYYSRGHVGGEVTGDVRSVDDNKYDVHAPPASGPAGLPPDLPKPPRAKISYG